MCCLVALQAAKDSVYLDRVRRLESEMDRVSSGLALVSQVSFFFIPKQMEKLLGMFQRKL